MFDNLYNRRNSFDQGLEDNWIENRNFASNSVKENSFNWLPINFKGPMKIKLPYMGKVAGLALIQSTVSAIGLLLTCILWDKWQSCHKKDGDDYIMYRMGLWEKCIDKFLLRESKCNKLTHETGRAVCIYNKCIS